MVVYDISNNFKDVTENFDYKEGKFWYVVNVSELDELKKHIYLDEDSLKECIDSNQASKICFYENYVFIVFNILHYIKGNVFSKELNVFFGKNYIITVFKEHLDIIYELISDISESKDCFILKEKPYPCTVFYYLLDRIIIKNYNVISDLEAEVDKIEISILKESNTVQVEQLIHFRRQVYKIRKYLNPLRYIGDSLVSNENLAIEKNCIIYFMSINNKVDKLMLSLESLIQDLALVREAFESETSNKATQIMKVFTMIATIFLPLNLISSMYGMNFDKIPFIGHEHGYYYVLGFMILVTASLILIFKRKKWL